MNALAKLPRVDFVFESCLTVIPQLRTSENYQSTLVYLQADKLQFNAKDNKETFLTLLEMFSGFHLGGVGKTHFMET